MKSPLLHIKQFLSELTEELYEEITFEAMRRFGVDLTEGPAPGEGKPDDLGRSLHVRAILDYIFLTRGHAQHHDAWLRWQTEKKALQVTAGLTGEKLALYMKALPDVRRYWREAYEKWLILRKTGALADSALCEWDASSFPAWPHPASKK